MAHNMQLQFLYDLSGIWFTLDGRTLPIAAKQPWYAL